jgi:hypothetical protein
MSNNTKKVTILTWPQRCWNVAEIHFPDGRESMTVNQFYEVTPDFILIYDTQGGSGYGWRKGALLHKIDIRDCELTTIEQK